MRWTSVCSEAERLKKDTHGPFLVTTMHLDSAESIQGQAAVIEEESPISFALCGLSTGTIVAMECSLYRMRRYVNRY